MGMYGRLKQITADELACRQSDPELVEEFTQNRRAAKFEAKFTEALKAARAAGKVGDRELQQLRMQTFKTFMEECPLQDGPTEDGLSIEKSWHALHYLLTGKTEAAPPPLGNAILGGEEIGEERDYGRVRFLTPQQVREVADALAPISKEELTGRFDVKSMKASRIIYPCRDQEELDIALHYFVQLVEYYSDAAKRGNAMLLYIE